MSSANEKHPLVNRNSPDNLPEKVHSIPRFLLRKLGEELEDLCAEMSQSAIIEKERGCTHIRCCTGSSNSKIGFGYSYTFPAQGQEQAEGTRGRRASEEKEGKKEKRGNRLQKIAEGFE